MNSLKYYADHEEVIIRHDNELNLTAVIAIHSTHRGPALGGCRIREYESLDSAVMDALLLSEGMTYKNSLAKIAFGGGKACILGNPKSNKERLLWLSKFAEWVNELNGRYITAEDFGTSVEDIISMREVTKYACCFAKDQGGAGDPSPWTALGVVAGMKAAIYRINSNTSLRGIKIAVQGIGKVGRHLCQLLSDEGAKLYISDTNIKAALSLASELNCIVVKPEGILEAACDILAPCATGQIITSDTIPKLRCSIIAGAANNQLENPILAKELLKRGILYCPDFAINAGGVVCAAAEFASEGWSEELVKKGVSEIEDSISKIFDESSRYSEDTVSVALRLAKLNLTPRINMHTRSANISATAIQIGTNF